MRYSTCIARAWSADAVRREPLVNVRDLPGRSSCSVEAANAVAWQPEQGFGDAECEVDPRVLACSREDQLDGVVQEVGAWATPEVAEGRCPAANPLRIEAPERAVEPRDGSPALEVTADDALVVAGMKRLSGKRVGLHDLSDKLLVLL